MTDVWLKRDRKFKATVATPEKVFSLCTASAHRCESSSSFALNPATRTLEILPNLRLKTVEALRGEARRFQLLLNCRSLGLDLCKLTLEARVAGFQMTSKFRGNRFDFVDGGHVSSNPVHTSS